MKISDLVVQLQSALTIHGDIPVTLSSDTDLHPGFGVVKKTVELEECHPPFKTIFVISDDGIGIWDVNEEYNLCMEWESNGCL